MIANFLGTNAIDFTMESTVAGRPARHFATAEALRIEVENARIWGGIHFRFSQDDGTKMGRAVYAHLSANYFKTAPGGLGPGPGLTVPASPLPPNTGSGQATGNNDAFPWLAGGVALMLLAGYLLTRCRRT